MSRKQLAYRGGLPAFPEGPPGWPLESPAVADALAAAARDGSWGRYDGPHGDRLAAALRELQGVEHVLLCSSGTIAVELALRGLGVTADDEVVLAGYDFPGNFRAIEAIGARPVVVDVALDRWTYGAAELANAWSDRTRALLVSHLHASLAPMQRIVTEARQRGVAVVEDSCQSPGAKVQGQRSGTWGDVSVLSFGGSKLLTAGRGGAIVTTRSDVYQRAKIFGDRGNQAFPLSELQAAVLLPQLAEIAAQNARRRAGVRHLQSLLDDCVGLRPGSAADPTDEPSYYKLSWFYEPPSERFLSRAQLVAAARAEGIALDTGFRGFVGRSAQRCRKVGDLSRSRRAAECTVLLHHPVLLADPSVLTLVAQTLRLLVEQ